MPRSLLCSPLTLLDARRLRYAVDAIYTIYDISHADLCQTPNRAPPAARPILVDPPSHEVRQSSPTRASTADTTSEDKITAFPALEGSEVTEAFPVLEETVAAPAAEPTAPVATRGRRRSSSFRSGTS